MSHTKRKVFVMSLKAALSLLALMASAQAGAATPDSFDDLKGSYEVKMQIGGRTFDEELVIGDLQPVTTGGFFERSFTGIYNVPGLFISPVQEGHLRRTYLCGRAEILSLDFSITAQENGQEFPVAIKAFGDRCSLTGTAKSKDGTEIGQLTMKQNSPDCMTGI